MKFEFAHNNINVRNLDDSVRFYREALGLEIQRSKDAPDGSFKIVWLGFEGQKHQLELTWLRDWDRPYNLGDNEIHLAFTTGDYGAALKKHKEMGCVTFENESMRCYFIADPDGYWTEIVPAK